ncbi:MCE family protein [Vandammella animalimorsus]|uniref:MCE family protein n=1 Tax=Vandammella animalimorsus TaxID=2029117 RepID=A0A3M6RL05_9BURK|nr:MlaD family protein [Vandammella animalimorsus]RMX15658.1 MCE family protein [Vandammella animalimorsus]
MSPEPHQPPALPPAPSQVDRADGPSRQHATQQVSGPVPSPSLGVTPLAPVPHLHFKSILLMLMTIALSIGALGYLLYARGAFENKQSLVLTADDSEGVSLGMDLTFSGFPIGRVRRIELADDGSVRIHIEVPEKNAHRLRESSIFTMVRNILGATSLKAYTSDWDDPPLPDRAVRPVLYGDASAEIPQLMASVRNLVNNLTGLTASDSNLAQSMARINELGGNLSQAARQGGALKILLGESQELQQLQKALAQVNTLLQSLNRTVNHADSQVFGQRGLLRDAQNATQQLAQLLQASRQSLKQIDAILSDAKTITGHVSSNTQDLQTLRASIESNLRQIDALMGQLQNTWPFAKEHQMTLP